MVKITPDPPASFPENTHRNPSDRLVFARHSISTEEALTTASEILDCAASTAYESIEGLNSPQRKHILTVVHLLDTAQALVEAALANQQPHAKPQSL